MCEHRTFCFYGGTHRKDNGRNGIWRDLYIRKIGWNFSAFRITDLVISPYDLTIFIDIV